MLTFYWFLIALCITPWEVGAIAIERMTGRERRIVVKALIFHISIIILTVIFSYITIKMGVLKL